MAENEQRCISAQASARTIAFWVIISVLLLICVWQGFTANNAYKETEIAQRHAKLWKDIISHSTQAVIVLDGEGKVVDWNSGATVLLGYTPQEMITKPIPENLFVRGTVYTEDKLPIKVGDGITLTTAAKLYSPELLMGKIFNGNVELRDKTGTIRIYDVRIQGVQNSHPWYVVQLANFPAAKTTIR